MSEQTKVRESRGTAFESRGKFFMYVTIAPQDRRAKVLPWCASLDAAKARALEVQALLNRLRMTGQGDFIEKIVEASATADAEKMAALTRAVDGITAGAIVKAPSRDAKIDTFGSVAEEWTSGRLHARYPDHVTKKGTSDEDAQRLAKWVYPHVKDTPIRAFTRGHAEEVMRHVSPTASRATRRHVAQLMGRVLNLAVYPLSLISASPLPRGFLPKVGKRIACGYLYPEEDARLLACAPREALDGVGATEGVPLPQRLLYGFLAREGMRCDEALSLTWADVDLQRGTVRLDENKTDDARTWALGADVASALAAWKKLCADADDTSKVFIGLVKPYHLAHMFRAHLKTAGVTRAELFERTEARRQIRVHDLRATFVTLALAAGKSETWVSDRTGHRSSVMLARYRRAARNAEELGLGWLAPLDSAIPELAPLADSHPSAKVSADPSVESEVSSPNDAIPIQFQRKDSNLRKRNQNPLSCR